MFKTTVENLSQHLINDLGIQPDDLVFMFSGLWGMGKLENGVETIEVAMQQVLPKGTLIVPTFSYSWSSGESFDDLTPCPEMGAFSNYVLTNSSYIRTNNPNFSVAIRENAHNQSLVNDFLNVGDDCFDENSIFGKVVKYSQTNRAWILLLGGAFNDVKYRSTFIHYAQQKVGVKHRYIKEFKSPTSDHHVVTQLVRYFNENEYFEITGGSTDNFNFPIEEDYSQYGEDVDAAGLLCSKKFGYYPSRMVSVKAVVDLYMDKIKSNPYYCIDASSLK